MIYTTITEVNFNNAQGYPQRFGANFDFDSESFDLDTMQNAVNAGMIKPKTIVENVAENTPKNSYSSLPKNS